MPDESNHPVVHFEIIGPEPGPLRGYYGELFGWRFDTSGTVSEAVSDPDDYGFMEPVRTPDGIGIPGGVGGGSNHPSKAMFYVGVEDVEEALAAAERLGGTRVLGPARAPSGLVVGHFTDPAGNSSAWPRSRPTTADGRRGPERGPRQRRRRSRFVWVS